MNKKVIQTVTKKLNKQTEQDLQQTKRTSKKVDKKQGCNEPLWDLIIFIVAWGEGAQNKCRGYNIRQSHTTGQGTVTSKPQSKEQ